MGIESDQLVYDYLSRVGDLAQQQQLSSGARMRLVATLRGEIDRQRGTAGPDSAAVVRRIIGGLGTPDQLVAEAARSAEGTVSLPPPRDGTRRAPARPRGVPGPRRGMLRKDAFRKGASGGGRTREEDPADEAGPGSPAGTGGEARTGTGSGTGAETGSGTGAEAGSGTGAEAGEAGAGWPAATAPHMAGLDQASSSGEADWWHVDPAPFGAEGVGVPGFVGGLESPELLRPGAPERAEDDAEAQGDVHGDGEEGTEDDAGSAPRRRRPRIRLRRRRTGGAAPEAAPEAAAPRRLRLSHPFLLLAAALLVAGAVLGSWVALAAGWLLAYSSRTLSRAEAKWVAMGLPGVVVAAAFVWLWGRMDGQWGSPLDESAMGETMTAAWPVIVRTAAVASALYLVWRSRRLPG